MTNYNFEQDRKDWDNYVNANLHSPKHNDQENIKKLKVREDLEKAMSQKQKEHSQQYSIARLEKEEVTNPKHYDEVGFGIQPLQYILANELDFLEGNIIKYISRYPHKGGVNDLLKARTYLEKLIERERIKND